MQPKRMPKIDKWALLLVLAGIGKAQWVGGAEPIRPVVRQVPSIDKGTTVCCSTESVGIYSNRKGWTCGSSSARPNVATADA